MEVSEIVSMTRKLTALFDAVVPRAWGIEAMVTELVAEVGTLADEIMITEGYRSMRERGSLDLADDVVDILFMLIRFADYYTIDLEQAYVQMVDDTKKILATQVRSAQ